MTRRMNWDRAKKPRRSTQPKAAPHLERAADKILETPMTFHEAEHASAERSYYKSVGSVLQRDGKWLACDGTGNVVGEYAERWRAWAHADKYGTQRAGELG